MTSRNRALQQASHQRKMSVGDNESARATRPVKLYFTNEGAWHVDVGDLIARPEVKRAFRLGADIVSNPGRMAAEESLADLPVGAEKAQGG